MENKANIKPIAFYLPQFHQIPENDATYGIGFTEWTNTRKAKRIFDWQYQPKTPLDKKYYNLLDEGVMEKQAEIAKEHGIYGFCYYHYWFENGKKLLEQPIERMLENRRIDIPFCLCWANENWTKRWDGGNNEVIVKQNYGNFHDLTNHIEYLCKYFKDDRYIKVDGKPLLLIYKPELIPNISKVVKTIRNQVTRAGFPGICIYVQYPQYFFNGSKLSLFDGYIQFQPIFIQYYQKKKNSSRLKKIVKRLLLECGFDEIVKKVEVQLYERVSQSEKSGPTVRSYDEDWKEILNLHVRKKPLIAGAFTDWDNTARNRNGLLYKGSTPEKFEAYMSQLIEKVKKEYSSDFIFVNAWNEWAEGAYLEADEKHGWKYLDALKGALKKGETHVDNRKNKA